ncbi:hypothetical protein B0A58_13770 [Flavobacterium branchiophilum NBRC 15030 = ATCC 35035]|uniref:Uncharacterized protein n=1 Tax=Flavobacterium branchiophilum TaxID=55197 RepID=A0A543G532_9FLAO|nr:hypothetical protein [Flavobacterium branchiophilum]OXA71348.1 hypothetical protein B0A58_13770 [Flavobacterium branchiophilum NBRC 15030 = ATCC 35035]TQM41198.1 hypothetical protein BC670_2140 [Flavobacterium branchiophilum]
MKKTIMKSVWLLMAMLSMQVVHAQKILPQRNDLPQQWSGVIGDYFKQYDGRVISVKITIMSTGAFDTNIDGGGPNWWVAYGNTLLNLANKSGQSMIEYTFSDRQISCSNNTYIFNTNAKENATLTWGTSRDKRFVSGFGPTELNLFKEWNLKITKAYSNGNVLYGEINNGKLSFSISAGDIIHDR